MKFEDYIRQYPTDIKVDALDPRVAAGVFHKRRWTAIVAWAAANDLRWSDAHPNSGSRGSPLQEKDEMFLGGDWNALFYQPNRGTLYRSGMGGTKESVIQGSAKMLGPPLNFSYLIRTPTIPDFEF